MTHRDATRSLTFVTGHTKDGKLSVDFAALARGGTLAVHMGVATLPQLRDGLQATGLDPAIPAALIERGGTWAQRMLHGTLDSLADEAAAWSSRGPTLALIGAAVGRAVPPYAGEVSAVLCR